jgi:hypothetical protein
LKPRERFQFVVEALPGSAAPILRLRKCLKLMLRWYGLRCVDCREVKPGGAKAAQEPAAGAGPG